jgi:uncharacterized protein
MTDPAVGDPAVGDPAATWVARLGLTPSPVGGWFGAHGASDETIADGGLPARFVGVHRIYSANWYLLESSQRLLLHSLKQDELWFFHLGDPVRLHVFDAGIYRRITLGPGIDQGQTLAAAAPHSTWFGAEPACPQSGGLETAGFSLVSCSLSPGYDPSDSSRPTLQELAALIDAFPAEEQLLRRLAGE